ncbi:MAG TPA: MBOAT family O-acyltransferase [Chitinophagaceae bacterium]|nr:MBOAT family O-acyltransferase [Chitinophagaceae bacterium]
MPTLSYLTLLIALLLSLTGYVFLRKPGYRAWWVLGVSLLLYWWVAGEKVVILMLYSGVIFIMGRIVRQSRHLRISVGAGMLVVLICLLPLLAAKTDSLLGWFPAAPLEFSPGNYYLEWLGVSYYVFNGLSYVVDVRRGYVEAARNFPLVLLYLSFYPVLFAGPLHRAKYFFFQLRSQFHFSIGNCRLAFRLLLIGLFKNLVLAQRLGSLVDVLGKHGTGVYVWLQGFCFVFYLYCTFSSYVDIARAAAKVLGISVVENFHSRVLASSSRQQFWRRWNMTVNNWFRDYLFFPLARLRSSRSWMKISLLLTFTLIGLWHGLSFQFAAWGLLNGIWILAEQRWAWRFEFIPVRLRKSLGIVYHLSVAAFLALVFISTDPARTASRLISHTTLEGGLTPQIIIVQLVVNGILFLLLDWLYRMAKRQGVENYLENRSLAFRWSVYVTLIYGILFLGPDWVFSNYYFQF